jgi:hypothetical protein
MRAAASQGVVAISTVLTSSAYLELVLLLFALHRPCPNQLTLSVLPRFVDTAQQFQKDHPH